MPIFRRAAGVSMLVRPPGTVRAEISQISQIPGLRENLVGGVKSRKMKSLVESHTKRAGGDRWCRVYGGYE